MATRFSNSAFRSSRHKRKYLANFEDRPCILARKIDQQSLEHEGVQCLQWIRDMGWAALINMDEMVYHDYTRLFYANAETGDEFSVFINGASHSLTSSILNQILGVPDEGEKLTPTRGSLCIRGYNAKRWTKKKTEGKTSNLPAGVMLNKDRRILHYIILEILCPKSGTKNNVSNFEIFLLWAIETCHPINLGHLLIQKMISTLHKGSSHLPYSMFITKIYKHFSESCSKEKGHHISSGNIMSGSWIKTLNFIVTATPPKPSKKKKIPSQPLPKKL